jgi:hypothetical protein
VRGVVTWYDKGTHIFRCTYPVRKSYKFQTTAFQIVGGFKPFDFDLIETVVPGLHRSFIFASSFLIGVFNFKAAIVFVAFVKTLLK